MLSTKTNPLLAFGAALVLSSCTVASVYTPLAQSNFAYPNSNVIPLKHAEGESSRTYVAPFQTPDFGAGEQTQEAINLALQQSGGDILVDGSYTMKATMVWLYIVEIYTVDVTVEGTASKMELGKRTLK